MLFVGTLDGQAILMLTEQDVNAMRGGRTKFADLGQPMYHKVILSLHKNQTEIEDALRAAGHGKMLEGVLPSMPKPGQRKCIGCDSILDEPALLEDNCIACWREKAKMVKSKPIVDELHRMKDAAKGQIPPDTGKVIAFDEAIEVVQKHFPNYNK